MNDGRSPSIAGAGRCVENGFLLYLENVRVAFEGFALSIDSFGVAPHSIQVIIGGNGAGKTTICDIISGKTRVSAGRIYFKGQDITRKAEDRIAERGIGRKFQTPTVFDSLTVFENMELAVPHRTGLWQNVLWRTRRAEVERIGAMLRRMELVEDQNTQARYLSHGKRQWLELAMLALAEPELLLVDEPAAGLTSHEVEKTVSLLRELSRSSAIIAIEHNMDFVRRLGAPVAFLDNGRFLAQGSLDEVRAHPAVKRAYWAERNGANAEHS